MDEEYTLPIEQAPPVENVMTIDTNQPVPAAPMSIDTGAQKGVPVPDQTAAVRAFKIKYGLPELIGGAYQDVYNELVQGNEDKLRLDAATHIDQKKAQLTQGLVTEFAGDPTPKTPEAIATLQGTLRRLQEPTDPTSVHEEQYAQAYIGSLDKVAERNEGTFVDEAKQEISEVYTMAELLGEDLTQKNEWLLTRAQNAKAVYDKQSYASFGIDIAKQFFNPLYGSLKTRGGLDTGFFEGGGKVGNIEAQAGASYRLPFGDFKKYWGPILDKMQNDNPGLTVDYISKLLGVSYTERHIGNFMEAVDVFSGPGFTRLGYNIAKVARNTELKEATKTAVSQMVKSSANAVPTKATIAEAAGDITEAATVKASENIARRMRGSYDPEKRAAEALPSALKQDMTKIADAPGRLSAPIVDIIERQTQITVDKLTKTLSESQKVNMLPALMENPNTMRLVKEEAMNNYPGLRNTVGDVWFYPRKLTNSIDVVYDVLNPKGELFFSKQVAEQFARVHNLTEFDAKQVQNGVGWYLRLAKPLDTKADFVRDGLLESKLFNRGDRPMQDWLNSFLGKYRTADETLSEAERQNRKVATYGTNKLYGIVENDVNFLQRFSQAAYKGEVKVKPTGETETMSRWTPEDNIFGGKKLRSRYKEWQRVIAAARDIDNKVTGKKGYFFENPGELDQFYTETVKRLPDETETQAYFAYKRILEVDRQLRNIEVLKGKLRAGTESHQVFSTTVNGKKIASDPFDGIRRFSFPGGDNVVMVMNKINGKEVVFNTNDPKRIKLIQQMTKEVEEGKWKVIEVHDPSALPLQNYSKKVGTNRVRYVVTQNSDTKPLQWEQVPRQGGGHFEYDYQFFIKQAIVRPDRVGDIFRHWYEGDATIMPVNIEKMGKDIVDKMNAVRVLLKEGNEKGAQALAQKTLPIEWSTFKGWFKDGHVNGQPTPPRLSLDEPFQVVQRDKTIGHMNNQLRDRYGETYRDGTRQGSAAKQNSVQFTGERDVENLMTFKNMGTAKDPIYNIQPAELVDPISSMNRAFARIANSSYLNDYKTFAVEHWLEKAKDYLKEEYIGAARSSPFWYFNNPEYLKGIEPGIERLLEAQRFQINQLMGVAGPLDGLLHRTSQQFANRVYGATGKEVYAPWVLSKLKDPFGFMRSAAFEMKLGMFALPQFVVQSMSYFTMFALAKNPIVATQGSAAAFMHQLSRINQSPKIMDSMDNIASKFGWKRGEWKEAREELGKTGFDSVGGEYSLLDQHMSPNLITSGGRQFLNAGQWAFREGERNARLGAWYIAFKEFKAANPTGKVTDLQRAKILERADILNVNMSRASASMLHRGALSVPMQFYTYQLRLFELMTGTRITGMEKIKLLATNAMLYGVPASTGLLGNPFVDQFRQAAVEKGYVVGDNFAQSIAMEGLLSGLAATITGKGDPRVGNWYNFADRYAMKGLDPVNNLLRGDKTFWEVAGGAVGGTFFNAVAASDGFVNAMLSMFPGRDPQKNFPITVDDVIDVAQEVTSANMLDRYLTAVNTGKWMSKKEVLLTNTSKANAFFMTMTGLQQQGVTDSFNASKINKARQDKQTKAEKAFTMEIGRMARALEDNNPEAAKKYHIRAYSHLKIADYPENKLPALIQRAYNTNKTSIDAADWSLHMGPNVPQSQKLENIETLSRKLQIQKERNR